jgi:hypothetical protein
MPFTAQAGLQGIRRPGPPEKPKHLRSSSHGFPIPSKGTATYLAAASVCAVRSTSAAPPLRFGPLQRFSTGGSGIVRQGCLPWLACVFRFSQPPDAFIRPSAHWPCFMPDPLMGFTLQSFPPPAQPYAVSGAVPLMTFSPPAKPHGRTAASRTEARQANGTALRETRKASLVSRVLLHARVRHLAAVV